MEDTDRTIAQSNCSKPPPLSDEELLSYIDGEAENFVRQHLEACSYCSARLEDIRIFENSIQKALYRADCPSAEHLADYAMLLLDATEMAEIRSHLDECRRCREEVELLRAALVIDEPPQFEQMRDLGKSKKTEAFRPDAVFTERILVQQPLYGQLKGTARSRNRLYSSGTVSVMLLVEPAAGRLKIVGNLSDAEAKDRWRRGSIELIGMSAGQPRFPALIDEDEAFTLDQVIPGMYNANFYSIDGQILRIRDIELLL